MRSISLTSLALAALLAGCGGDDGNTNDEPPLPDTSGAPAGWADEVPLAILEDIDPAADVVEVALEAKVATVEYRPGVATEVWTYNGTVPGPMLRAKVGDTVVVHFTNHLPEATTIHWHGLRVPAEMDGAGHMTTAIEPGASFDYRFVVPDAGLFWFHPHVRSDVQVEKGLYGTVLVEDPAQPDLGDTVTLVLDDVALRADGSLAPPGSGGHMEEMIGRQGNTLLVNGRIAPTLLARAGRPQHWRLVNTANARYFHLEIPGHRIVRVGGDAGLVPAPVERDSLLLVPGERAEIVVTPVGEPGDRIVVRNLPYERGHGTGLEDPAELFAVEIADLPAEQTPQLPSILGTVEPIVVDGSEPVQTVALSEVMNHTQMIFRINGQAWPDVEPLTATVGETQVWEVTNETNMDHPFHLHGFFFQVQEVNGAAPALREWKDSVNVPAEGTLRFAVRYDDRPGGWMFHCHILEHAELGMMGELQLVR